MKKLLAMLLAAVMLFSLAACGGLGNSAMTESPLPESKLTVDYEIKDDFKIGYICLHDEQSTYDLNFLDAADAVTEALGLKDDQVIIKTNVEEG
ncbi:MAG: hypothetical protein IJZ13_00475, partial [Clostridia bacterium]|nr:hypothetical protein [Clostridia bacterium]